MTDTEHGIGPVQVAWRWYDPLLRIWKWYVNRHRERLGWPRLDTGQLPDLRDGSGITGKLRPLLADWQPTGVSRETEEVKI